MGRTAFLRVVSLALVGGLVATACTSASDSLSSSSSTTAAPTTTTIPTTTTTFPFDAEVLGIGDDYYPELGNPGYDVASYRLDLSFAPETETLSGTVELTATATTDLRTLNVDLAGFNVAQVTVNDLPARVERVAEELTIAPAMSLSAGDTFSVAVEYSGKPTQVASTAVPFGIGWNNSISGQHYVVAEPDGAHTWFPSNDHPLDKATYEFRITVPDPLIAAANGTFVETIEGDGESTWVWRHDSPMATYLATVVIGNFTVVVDDAGSADAGLPIRHVLPGTTSVADWPGLERQGEMLAFMETIFGPYPFDVYGIAIVDGFNAALENQTLSLFDTLIAQSAFFEIVLIHELAHQWFGNSVSPARWQDIWLNEGFASYAEWLWLERESGRRRLDTDIGVERGFFSTLPDLVPPGSPTPDDLFNQSVYRVGAMTLHALRLTVGDDAFFDILRTYASRFRDGNALTDDFVAVAEEISGVELDELFQSWLYDEGLPNFPEG